MSKVEILIVLRWQQPPVNSQGLFLPFWLALSPTPWQVNALILVGSGSWTVCSTWLCLSCNGSFPLMWPSTECSSRYSRWSSDTRYNSWFPAQPHLLMRRSLSTVSLVSWLPSGWTLPGIANHKGVEGVFPAAKQKWHYQTNEITSRVKYWMISFHKELLYTFDFEVLTFFFGIVHWSVQIF